MIPQGQSLIDTSYFDNLTAKINAIQGAGACEEIQDVVDEASASINAQLTAIRSQIAALLPATTMPSANLGSIVTWITNFAAPLITAYNNLVATEAAVLSAVSKLETAIANAAARLTSCSVNIPPMT